MRSRPERRWRWFAAWALAAILAVYWLSFGVSPLLGGLIVLAGVVLVRGLGGRFAIARAAYGALAGVGAILLFFAYLDRDDAGGICPHRAALCPVGASPLPWLIAAVALLLLALGLFLADTRRRASARSAR
ncbi:MAG TPA: hypothetical protein VL977_03920 [Solirubrobacteraceae bacterium]|nr:hypothetical protein [Solirubrobacteraceae bacterium]